jgi:biofilm PGA synthesis N-glycosyltransferase PgaC
MGKTFSCDNKDNTENVVKQKGSTMKKALLYIFLYGILIAIIGATHLIPVNLQRDQLPFFHFVFICIIITNILWIVKTVVFTLLAPWYTSILEWRRRTCTVDNSRPLVSTIIPAWNEEVGLVSTVKTLLISSYRPLEIVVVNDGSTDGSDEKMRAFIQEYQSTMEGSSSYVPIIYHYQANGGKGSALNTGISLSHGEIIVTFDADSVVHKHAIQHFVSYFADPGVMAAAGNIKIGNTKTILGLIQSLEYCIGFQLKKTEALFGIVFVIGGAAAAFRREVFQRLGKYNVGTLTEDLDISLRIQEAGMRIVYVPEAIVHTEGPTTLQGLLKQRLRWKRGRIEALNAHRSSIFNRKKGARKPFFWIVLPMILVEDIQSMFGALYVILVYAYSLLTLNFSLLLLNIVVTGAILLFQLSEDRHLRELLYILLIPISWFLLHFVTFVELNAFCKALYTFCRKREVKWQKWQRTGV